MENRFLPSIVEMASDFTDWWFIAFLLVLFYPLTSVCPYHLGLRTFKSRKGRQRFNLYIVLPDLKKPIMHNSSLRPSILVVIGKRQHEYLLWWHYLPVNVGPYQFDTDSRYQKALLTQRYSSSKSHTYTSER